MDVNAPTQVLEHQIIQLACRAPSVHNTQPWRWRIRGAHRIELWADRTRQLTASDPDGRNLAISCGAALHHLVVAAHALGARASVELMPDLEEDDLLAAIHLTPAPEHTDAAETLDVLARRCTDRRRFTSWPVPEGRLTHLARAAAGWGGYAIPLLDEGARFRTELLLSRALTAQEADPAIAAEQRLWTGHSADDGVPPVNTGPRSPDGDGEHRQRFEQEGDEPEPDALVESSEALIAICTTRDDQRAWLETGQVLSALWLRATREGLSVVPLSQVIEVPETRNALRHDVLAGMVHPQILLRIGWQEIARTTLIPTPRRPLDDVLLA